MKWQMNKVSPAFITNGVYQKKNTRKEGNQAITFEHLLTSNLEQLMDL